MDKRIQQLNEKIEMALSLIKNQYLFDDGNLPWLIGYSGGKDSTCTAQLVFRALAELKSEGKYLNRQVSIFSSDTMIENPLVKVIVEENIEKINIKAKELGIPVKAFGVKPKIDETFWVNVIGKGYPTPNTMFRWCTDRLKIEPANDFIRNCIDKSGEVIMVLGVREGESGTRDRVLKTHSIEGQQLMKHTTLTNAYIFAPIKFFATEDIFLYLNTIESPWGSSNKKLYFFYEESGGGECPMFLAKQDMTTSNSCGNSRMGCWCCTVVAKDKSLSGFISTGYHDELTPLLEYRNWIATIRDNEEYRCFHRMNGSVYTKAIEMKEDSKGMFLSIPEKGSRKKVEIRLDSNGEIVEDTGFTVVDKDELSAYMKRNGLTYKDAKMAKIILKDKITGEYAKIGTGPFNDRAKKEMFYKLIETEYKYNQQINGSVNLILDAEIEEIKKLWLKASMDISFIDETMKKFERKPIELIQDSFDLINQNNEKLIRSILEKNNLDYETLNNLVLKEKLLLNRDNRGEMQSYIDFVFKTDKLNY